MTEQHNMDAERRFGGLDRLYGAGARERLAAAHVMVAGIGGVGTWAVEALARSAVGRITLIDLDNIAESNINRQLPALDSTLGMAKIEAMAQRIAQINPQCQLQLIEDFVTEDNAASLMEQRPDVFLDCTDQASAKIALILQARRCKVPLLSCGGAGGKTDPLTLRRGDLSVARHDALLGKLRQILRKQHGFARGSDAQGRALKRVPRMGVDCLWFEQETRLPQNWTQAEDGALQGLACAGYGSGVTVTASMGMQAADYALNRILDQ
ncbi:MULTISPECIES: tRNA threonylcarbamoyladenosine dehydratase [Alcaligenes]|uniref:tRNA threonylcarbamoyladenosine dehydratase n=1 Tax=Alcaligenes TaxID=507 RepID=UPI000E9D05F1|nr:MULTISPECIES: tRNA threonylcarbamoyladenosine dehydratase [Alcaligenes]UUO11826.1 tRNA threonylcarbamoyladenosine dehydratase [Alcaligenes faecalis]HBJ67206.1 tRNA threonylcarbamoyladenosine dehydratase [Alcaligenes faecalis]